MAPLELDGETLGEKHRDYNKKLEEYIVNEPLSDDKQGDDVNNLLKIDIASRNKDVEYILSVLKSDDMLYVSRALARCKWLITDQNYVNIINPNYLQTELFPNMTTKAITKLKKHIRHNINDEKRAENFYLNESNKADAIKWLPHCSVEFIEKNIANHDVNSIKTRLFKRLCERSISIFEIILKNQRSRWKHVKAATFLLNTDVDKYLDILEKYNVNCPKLSHKSTELIMKHSPKRVMDNIEKYISIVHKPTFVKYLSADEIKNLLQTEDKQKFLLHYNTLKHFIYRLPKEEQFQFAKKVCMSKGNDADNKMVTTRRRRNIHEIYFWYEFAPFEVAFKDITDLISQNADNLQKEELFSLLIGCAKHKLQNIQDIIKYYVNKHKNESSTSKLKFVSEIFTHVSVSKYDATTWNILNELLASVKVYDEPTVLYKGHKNVVNSIIICNAINDEITPEIIEKNFVFNTLKSYKSKLNKEQQNKIFNYLYGRITSKLNDSITDKNFGQEVNTIVTTIKLLQDWDKSLLDYPVVLNKIRQMIKLKKENSWKDSLSPVYNANKSWRKHMFEESLALCPKEEVCLNALKHDPGLLSRSNEEMTALKTDDSVSLQRLQAKLRIYWPHSVGQQWIDEYLNKINETNEKGQKAAVLGICNMVPQKALLDIIEKCKPDSAKIDWKHIDERVLNIQRHLAKNMHRGRPQPTPNAILSYAKGDYLQFALPSLLAILYNLKTPIANECIPKLLDTPVSLQKHGIRFAFKRLDHDSLKKVFSNCWKTSKNATIRAIIFKFAHSLLCNEKDDANAVSLWELLEMFIDNLTFTEDKEIYKMFSKVEQIPINVRANYIVKSYNYLQKLIPHLKSDQQEYRNIIFQLKSHSREVMETISSDFVTSIIQEYIDTTFLTEPNVQHSDNLIQVISAYLLCCKTENEQIKKYETVFIPIMQRSLENWGKIKEKNIYFVRRNFDQLLTRFNRDLKDYVVKKEKIIPVKMFTLIMAELEKALTVPENYMILTKWKLTVALATLAQEYSLAENEKKIGLEFGKKCLEYLKTDVQQHFSAIYVLFSKCLNGFNLSPNAKLQFFNGLLSDEDFVQAYLSSIEIGLQSGYIRTYDTSPWIKIAAHPSLEVKMHYSSRVNKRI